jgi:competence protein ComEC
MVGVWLGDTLGPVAGPWRWVGLLVPPAGLVVLVAVGAARRRPLVVLPILCLMAAAVGFARQQAIFSISPNHVTRMLGDEPVLTRVVGEVLTRPHAAPPEIRNGFLPFTPPPTTRFVVNLRELRMGEASRPITGRVRVRVDAVGLGLHVGDRVELTGKLHRPTDPRNPGETDWARTSTLQGIDAGLSVEGAPYVRALPATDDADGWSVTRAIQNLRLAAGAMLLEPGAELDVEAADRLLDTMVLGQRGAAGADVNEAFLAAGGMHFLAVSGFHVAVLAGAVWLFAHWVLRVGRRSATLATLPVILLYALIAEPNAPVLRATVGAVIAALALVGRRPFCVVNWLALAAMCILIYNPRELFRPGFQLSFVQVLALLVLAGPVCRLVLSWRRGLDAGDPPREPETIRGFILHRLHRFFVGLFIVCVVAWCSSLPLVLLHFGRCSMWGIVGTTLLTIPAAMLICLSFVTMLVRSLLWTVGTAAGSGSWLSTDSAWLTAPPHVLSDWLLTVAKWFQQWPGAVCEVTPPPAWSVFAAYGVLLPLAWLLRRRPERTESASPFTGGTARYRWLGGLTAVALYALLLAPSFEPVEPALGTSHVHVFSVGNGNAVLVTAPNGSASVCDAGSIHNTDAGETVVRAMRVLGYQRLQDVYISHANFDHYSGVPSLLKNVPTEQLCHSPHFAEAAAAKDTAKFTSLLPPQTPPRVEVFAGQQRTLGPLPIEVLWPPADLDPQTWSANDRSLVLRVHAGGRTIMLPGDVEEAAIQGLLSAEAAGRVRLSADVLIAPHHGSVAGKETAVFLAVVDPEVIIVSSATPRPAFEAVVREVLGDRPRVLNTHDAGAVSVTIQPTGEITIETMLAAPETPGSAEFERRPHALHQVAQRRAEVQRGEVLAIKRDAVQVVPLFERPHVLLQLRRPPRIGRENLGTDQPNRLKHEPPLLPVTRPGRPQFVGSPHGLAPAA